MNQLQMMEQGWRNVVFRQIEIWDRVADCINPLLFVALFGAALCLSRTSHANAWRFLARSALALSLTFLTVKTLQKLDWFEAARNTIEGGFPSTHMAVATSLATSLFFAARKWLSLAPVLLFYAWLMTALRFHLWIDIAGSVLIAAFATATLQVLMTRKQSASRTSDMTSRARTSTRSSTRSRSQSSLRSPKNATTKNDLARNASAKNATTKSVKTKRQNRSKTRRF